MDGVEVYETYSNDSSTEEIEVIEEMENPEILSLAVSQEDALKEILGQRRETLTERIARIRREIEEIRAEAPSDLLSELHSALHKPSQPKELTQLEQRPTDRSLEASNQFAALEARVTQLEQQLGASRRSPTMDVPISDQLERMQAILKLLSTDPELVAKRVEAARELKNSSSPQVEWVYNRLQELGPQLRAIPSLVSRLQTLRFFHAETLNSRAQIQSLEAEIATIKQDMAEWVSLLDKLAPIAN